jgi:hypothetical protein
VVDLSPDAMNTFLGTVLISIGGAIGGNRAIDKYNNKHGNGAHCHDHSECFKEITHRLDKRDEDITSIKEGIAFIRGKMEG